MQSEAVALRHLLLGRAIRVVFLAGDTAIRVVFLARDTANPAVLHTLRKPEYDIFADLREKDHAETERRALLFDDMEPLEEKYRLAQQWIAHYHPHTEYTESEKDG